MTVNSPPYIAVSGLNFVLPRYSYLWEGKSCICQTFLNKCQKACSINHAFLSCSICHKSSCCLPCSCSSCYNFCCDEECSWCSTSWPCSLLHLLTRLLQLSQALLLLLHTWILRSPLPLLLLTSLLFETAINLSAKNSLKFQTHIICNGLIRYALCLRRGQRCVHYQIILLWPLLI